MLLTKILTAGALVVSLAACSDVIEGAFAPVSIDPVVTAEPAVATTGVEAPVHYNPPPQTFVNSFGHIGCPPEYTGMYRGTIYCQNGQYIQ